MPGPGTGAVAVVIGSTFCCGGKTGGCRKLRDRRGRQLGRGERHGVPAEPQEPVERRPELLAQALEAGIGSRYETVDLDQGVDPLGVLAGRHEGASEAEGGEGGEHAAAADIGGVFRRDQGAVPPGLLLAAMTDRQRVGAVGTGVAARSEEHTSELQSPCNLVCRLLLEKK